ncbi:hypothetical protein BOTNAR_0016g00240 [Botryotinia narcissicola]|uniref:Uncharacterized protein n=1 Tax=Botryotinia narcissicola TaxID=278944 RepID=A0A4Z1J5L1_9HELO|nr:hypothetical protein BOTNAR_0016g00240 [Botryotinia narcissicola]
MTDVTTSPLSIVLIHTAADEPPENGRIEFTNFEIIVSPRIFYAKYRSRNSKADKTKRETTSGELSTASATSELPSCHKTTTTSLTFIEPSRSRHRSHSLSGLERCLRQLPKRMEKIRKKQTKSPQAHTENSKISMPIQANLDIIIHELITNLRVKNFEPLEQKVCLSKKETSRKQRSLGENNHAEVLDTCRRHLIYLCWHTNQHHSRKSNTNDTKSMAHQAPTVKFE